MGLVWFLVRILIRTTKKGTTLEGLGKLHEASNGLESGVCCKGFRVNLTKNLLLVSPLGADPAPSVHGDVGGAVFLGPHLKLLRCFGPKDYGIS